MNKSKKGFAIMLIFTMMFGTKVFAWSGTPVTLEIPATVSWNESWAEVDGALIPDAFLHASVGFMVREPSLEPNLPMIDAGIYFGSLPSTTHPTEPITPIDTVITDVAQVFDFEQHSHNRATHITFCSDNSEILEIASLNVEVEMSGTLTKIDVGTWTIHYISTLIVDGNRLETREYTWTGAPSSTETTMTLVQGTPLTVTLHDMSSLDTDTDTNGSQGNNNTQDSQNQQNAQDSQGSQNQQDTQNSQGSQDQQDTQNSQSSQNTQDTKPVFTGKTNAPAPQTGDTSATIMYGVMLALSAITSIVLIARKRKKI